MAAKGGKSSRGKRKSQSDARGGDRGVSLDSSSEYDESPKKHNKHVKLWCAAVSGNRRHSEAAVPSVGPTPIPPKAKSRPNRARGAAAEAEVATQPPCV